ncbi:MAG TPA: isoprenylcysteine carboxylmethyltransferase family protein [Bryobacteraceae bacterium]|jgi:protein-S-isoprenylcysteine O-methyltransferase Ste14
MLSAYLLSGLLLHKAVWEVMKNRKRGTDVPRRETLKTRLVSLAKVAILCGLIIQAFHPDFLPIVQDAATIRVVGLALYTAGLLFAITARIQLGRNWSDIEKSRVVAGHELVARGVYRYIRHPIYTGDLMLLAGFELALNSWLVAGVAAVALYVRGQAVSEESKLLASLPGYDRYSRETGRFLPVFRKNASGS